jgi:hypothetical protein
MAEAPQWRSTRLGDLVEVVDCRASPRFFGVCKGKLQNRFGDDFSDVGFYMCL